MDDIKILRRHFLTTLTLWILLLSSAHATSNKEVIGYFDEITVSSEGTRTIAGWACLVASDQSIPVDVYIGPPENPQNFYGRFLANSDSESGVAEACQAGGKHYRFLVPVSTGDHQGLVYIYGISPI